LDAFRELLAESLDAGHRILVFSQFTKLLALVREELDAQGIPHAYLDGAMTLRARQAEVDRFNAAPPANNATPDSGLRTQDSRRQPSNSKRQTLPPSHESARGPTLETLNSVSSEATGPTLGTPNPGSEAAAIPVFLISLKAGGAGLNLAAADTVIHLDPWWNPAVEAQATDRAHRIGQTRVVTSYKLICAGTVEEKVLQLQDTKRALLANVFEASDAATAKLSLDDLKALLK